MLHNLFLTMYVIGHLRGNAILEPTDENNTFSEAHLAEAQVTGKVRFAGTFLRVA
ncbi:MAG TPA: hypothetical protein PLO37_15670 [Candidatus Hydrogenedentes bacterium]|nr:hypothetical protein [Candidatus Hydrogenedentota bacterium]HPG68285.1 hypothetical protein [Candidatus Hydrogenedentota bacterium]